MNKILKAINPTQYKWLLNCIKPNMRSILLITLLNAVVSVSSVVIALTTKQMIDMALNKDIKHSILAVVIFISLLLLQIGINAFLSMYITKLYTTMSYRLQNTFLKKLYKIEWLTLNKFHSGDIFTRLNSDIDAVVDCCTNIFPSIIALILQLITAFISLFYLDKELAIFSFILGPLTAVFSFFVGQKIRKLQLIIQNIQSKYISYINEVIHNILIVKTFENENKSIEKIGIFQKNKYKTVMKRSKVVVRSNIVLNFSYYISFFAAFAWGTYRLSTGNSSFGTFAAFLQLIEQVQDPMAEMADSIPQIISTMASVERLMEFESYDSEAEKTKPDCSSFYNPRIIFNNVSFHYEKSKPILSNINLTIEPGDIIALIGSSGEGKTTLVRMLLALIKPESGTVKLCQENKSIDINANTREFFSYVPQGNTLFSGSIAANLRLGSSSATDEKISEALKAACILPFVQTLKDGINTLIGENGIGLSEGQSQRIAIARALIRESPVIIFDESTSALDAETEKTLLDNIKALKPARTCIIITHRTSIYSICDNIYNLKNKTLLEWDGTYEKN